MMIPALRKAHGRLVVVGWSFFPAALIDGIAIASRDPDDRGVFLAIVRVWREVGTELTRWGVVTDELEQTWRRLGCPIFGAWLVDEFGLEALSGVGERAALICLAACCSRQGPA